MRTALAAIVVIHGLGAGAVSADNAGDDQLILAIDALFGEVTGLDEPGCCIGVMRGDQIIYRRGYGAANVAYAAPIDSQTVFEIASGSKTFTAACIALLMDESRLSLDADVRSIITELQLNRPVRIRDLLRCESGVWAQFHIMPLAGWDNVPTQSPYSKEDFLTVLSGQRQLPFEPGTQFQYGSGDLFLLGIVVERLTGMSLAQFAQERLFRPLGMTRTWYLEDPALVVKNRAIGHWKSDVTWSTDGSVKDSDWRQWCATAYLGGGGSLVTCVDDLLRWARIYEQDLLPRGVYIDELTGEGTVAGNRSVLDVDAYLKRVHSHPQNEPAGVYRGLRRFQVTGGYWGFTGCLSHFPDQATTIVCLSNNKNLSAAGTAQAISDVVLADDLAPLADDVGEVEPKFITVPVEQLRRLAGAYRMHGNSSIWRIDAETEGLRLIDGLGGEFTIKSFSPTRFKPIGDTPFAPSAVFSFSTSDDGSVFMTLSSVRGGRHEELIFRKVTMSGPYDEASLRKFAGTFVSEELGAIYRVRFSDARLELRVGSRRWEPMAPLEADEFTPIVEDPHNTRFLRFTRDEGGDVDGFSIGFWRIAGVRFDRVQPDR